MARAPAAAPAPQPEPQNEGADGAFPNVEQAGLMRQLYDAEAGGLYLQNTDVVQSLIAASWAEVDTANVKGDAAFVALSSDGVELVEKANPPSVNQSKPKAKETFELTSDVPMPTIRRRGREGSGYPIDTMEVGQSFHVSARDGEDDPLARISSTISAARLKYSEEVPGEFEEGLQRNFKKDADGKRVKGPDGKFIFEGSVTVQKPKRKQLRDWCVASVDADDPKGPGARVWRTL